jgi:hypothetical protein
VLPYNPEACFVVYGPDYFCLNSRTYDIYNVANRKITTACNADSAFANIDNIATTNTLPCIYKVCRYSATDSLPASLLAKEGLFHY